MNTSMGWIFGICAAACVAIIVTALHLGGAAEIRADSSEVQFLTVIGFVWLATALNLFSWLGLSFQHDIVDNRNVPAAIAICGATMAAAMLYAGGNIGEGPSFWEHFFSVGLGIAGWLVLWIILELGAKVSMSIAEERDLASGLRMGGFQLATGLILGRAVAGDWESEMATVRDFFHDGGPAAVLCAIAVVVEKFAAPNRKRPFPPWRSFGLLPAVSYLAFAAAWLWHLGWWKGMPS